MPQESIFGPLLFLIYINDLPVSSLLYSLLFADDTTLLHSHAGFDTLVKQVNTEFKKVVDYFRTHKFALNPDKTKFMVFSTNAEVREAQFVININFNNDLLFFLEL